MHSSDGISQIGHEHSYVFLLAGVIRRAAIEGGVQAIAKCVEVAFKLKDHLARVLLSSPPRLGSSTNSRDTQDQNHHKASSQCVHNSSP